MMRHLLLALCIACAALFVRSTRADIVSDAPVLDVNAALFPASSLLNFGRDLVPTGACGRVFAGTDGHLYFEDGSRAVFWGVNIAKDSVFQPRQLIDQAIEAIARAGFNLVRFHHLDDVNGLLPRERAGQRQRIDPEKLDRLDYWIYRLGQRGIYVYLDLLDYRTFWPEEGVADGPALGRGAKPYAVFDQRLIALQADYARQLLREHVNPYTGRTYASDPAVLFIELCDENGLFRSAKRGLALRQPYREQLSRMFSQWLQRRYGSEEALRRAWRSPRGGGLASAESLSRGTVRVGDLRSGTPRDVDTALFFSDVHREYFRALRKAIDPHGAAELVIGGVAEPTIPADLRAAAASLDFVGVNWYWDHPMFSAQKPWQPPYYFFNHSPMSPPQGKGLEDFAPVIAAARVYRTPLVVREWSPCWPNDYRAAALIEAAAYGALQDVDAMILFHFSTDPGRRTVGFFDVRHDPARWSLAALAGQVFRRRLVSPAPYLAVIGYSATDVLLEPLRPMPSQLHKLGYVCRIANAFFDDRLTAAADLIISSGRSAGGTYPPSRVLLFSNSFFKDPYRRQLTDGLDSENGCEAATIPGITAEFVFGGTIFSPRDRRRVTADPAYFLPDVENNPDLRPIGRCRRQQAALGVRNMALKRYCFKKLPENLALRAAIDALAQLTGDDTISHEMLDTGVLRSAGGQVRTDRRRNLLIISAPQVCAVAGNLGGRTLSAGELLVHTATPIGAVVWLSLDGKPPRASRKWVLKMASIARNTGERTEQPTGSAPPGARVLRQAGAPPVLTVGRPGPQTRIVLAGQPVLGIGLVNGTWELVRQGSIAYLWCDTPAVTVEVPFLGAHVRVDEIRAEGLRFAGVQSQPLQYPSGVRFVRIMSSGREPRAD